MFRLCFLSLLACCWVFAPSQVQAAPVPERIALVIGNGHYESDNGWGPLKGPGHDAASIRNRLKSFGFDQVFYGRDLERDEFEDLLDQFIHRVGVGDLAVIYYSGHGIGVSGRNYFIPVDHKIPQVINRENQITRKAIDIEEDLVDPLMMQHPSRIVSIIDACRNNPVGTKGSFGGIGGGMKGIGRSTTSRDGQGTLLSTELLALFATGSGNTARDANSSKKHSLFTEILLTHMQGDVDLVNGVFPDVNREVRIQSGGLQNPSIEFTPLTKSPWRLDGQSGVTAATLPTNILPIDFERNNADVTLHPSRYGLYAGLSLLAIFMVLVGGRAWVLAQVAGIDSKRSFDLPADCIGYLRIQSPKQSDQWTPIKKGAELTVGRDEKLVDIAVDNDCVSRQPLIFMTHNAKTSSLYISDLGATNGLYKRPSFWQLLLFFSKFNRVEPFTEALFPSGTQFSLGKHGPKLTFFSKERLT